MRAQKFEKKLVAAMKNCEDKALRKSLSEPESLLLAKKNRISLVEPNVWK
jgi:hypothetical protein